MVIDTSALLALLFAEPEAERLTIAIAGDSVRLLPVTALVEASAVLLARSPGDSDVALDALLNRLEIDVIPLTAAAAAFARRGFATWGKGAARPGILNFGDCLSYGVARALAEPLLFTGRDFSRTDVEIVAY
jgi:ribonuclease VapC